MRFGRVNVADAAGTVLAHAVRVGGRTFKKGRVLSTADIEMLEREGFDAVVGATVDPGDVTEDRAAQTAAQSLAGGSVRVGAPFTGRCNVFAAVDGLFLASAPDIDRFNAVDEALTVATLSAPRAVREGEMLATVKVIPFAVPGPVLDRALACLGTDPAIRVEPFEPMATAVIQTRLPAGARSMRAPISFWSRAHRPSSIAGTSSPAASWPPGARCSIWACRSIRETCSCWRAAAGARCWVCPDVHVRRRSMDSI